ncbi:MAG: amidohydrolase family protein [bacterium]
MSNLKKSGLNLVLILALVILSFSRSFSQEPVNEQLFTNGSIYINADKKVDNLLVKDGVVAGYNVAPAEHGKAAVIDLKGAAAYPGFCDSHVHLMEAGYSLYVGAYLLGTTDADSMARVLEEKVKSIPDGGIILGLGYSLRDYDKWSLADLAKIDAVTGNHPAFLCDTLGHNAVINTAAMKLTNVTPKTPVPPGGKMGIENGRLTGMMRESAMNLPGVKIFSMADPKDIKIGTLKLLQRWASIGYTGAVDPMGGPGFRIMHPEIFKEMEKEGTLPLRINYCYVIFNLNDVDDAARYMGQDTDLVRFAGCKVFVDGAFSGGQAWTGWKNRQGGHGLQEVFTDDKEGSQLNLNRIVAKIEEYGMNVQYHAQGDKAIGAILDALDKVMAAQGRLKGIHIITHAAFTTDAEIVRIKKFDGHVVITAQPGFWPVESDTAYYYGDRASQAYPIKKLIDSGISVGISTDFSVSPPQYTPASVVIGVAATGGGDPKNHPPISIQEMIRGLTLGSAMTTGKDDVGTLDIGKKADLVVYETDLLTVPPEKLTAAYPRVLSTWLGGRKVYDASAVK